MPRRSLVVFLTLVFVVTVAGMYVAMRFFPPAPQAPVVITVPPLIVTATDDPARTPASVVVIVTATPRTEQLIATQANVDSINTTPEASGLFTIPTLDSTSVSLNPSLGLTATGLPANCILHTVVEGDTPFGIAVQYGADPFEMLTVNGLTEETATQIQIGEALIVPLEGCPIVPPPTETPGPTDEPSITATDNAQTPEETETPADSPTPTPSPTITLAPTAANAQVEVVEVLSAGDVTAEGVRIRNKGNTVNITGWTLSDGQGNTFTFPQQLLFSNAELTVFTRAGANTPVVLFWGLDTAVWGDSGDVLTLTDAEGKVQATLRLPTTQQLN